MFRIRWKGIAISELADLWNRADSAERNRITRASSRIEYLLRSDPENQGESRHRAEGSWFTHPSSSSITSIANSRK